MAKPKAVGPTRRRHTNSKLGCVNCKRKKIRCDENLPQCNNCVKGKKDQCSYLTLSKQEINKIKLTHSLRDSQNKLLCQDYRLPTSKKIYKSKEYDHFDALDIKFELQDWPVRIPSIIYPPLHYNHLTIYDFSSEFKVIEDDEEDKESVDNKYTTSETTPVVQSVTPAAESAPGGKPLPNASVAPIEVAKIRHRPIFHRIIENTECSVIHRDTIWGSMLQNLHRAASNPDRYNIDFLFDIIVCLGANVVLNQLASMLKYAEAHRAQYSSDYLDLVEKRIFETHSRGLLRLKVRLSKYNAISSLPRTAARDKYINYMAPMLYYSNKMLCDCIALMKFSMESYNKVNSSNTAVILNYLNYGIPPNEPMEFILNTMKLDFISFKIPSYEPTFVFEIIHNLETLRKLYEHRVPNLAVLNQDLDRLAFQYNSLVQFLKNELVPILYSERKAESTMVYRSGVIFEVLCRWISLVPSQAIAYYPNQYSGPKENADYYHGLATTLYSYYYCIGHSLMSVFPEASYLFNLNFVSLSSQFYTNADIFGLSKNNPLHIKHYDMETHEILRRHIYYALRVFSFFKERTKIFYKNSRFNGSNFKLTKFPVKETTINTFNTTLIRPNHYPSATAGAADDITFGRVDETMTLNIYGRNIETLTFFSKDCHLQFDPETLLLLRDYRPFGKERIYKNIPVSKGDVVSYTNDKSSIFTKYR